MVTNNCCNYQPLQYQTQVGGATGTLASVSTGTAKQVLTSNGASAAPTYQSIPLNWVETLTANNDAELIFDNLPAQYNTYLLIMRNVTSATDNVNLTMVMSKDNGANWITSGYESAVVSNWYTSSNTLISNSTSLFLLSKTGISNASADESYNGQVTIYGVNVAAKPHLEGRAVLFSGGDTVTTFNNIFASGGDTNLNALKLSMTSGNIATGVFSLYGYIE